MKRCPECLFLYNDSDERCDFDKTLLEVVDDAEIEAVTRPSKSSKRSRRVFPIVAAAGLLLGVFVFAIYYAATRQTQKAAAAPQTSSTPVPVVATPQPASPSPSPTASPSPSPSPKAPVNTTPAAAHTRASTDPVSTSGPGIGNRQGGKPVIVLTSGGKIEADEVWRTKDGVWYRRNGIVTLLKRGQVKTIVTR
jgi:cytoskeletal protein RodZ